MSCPWAERYTHLPDRGEVHPGDAGLIAVSYDIQGLGRPTYLGGVPGYEFADITVNYATRSTASYPLASSELSGEYLEINGTLVFMPMMGIRMSIEVDTWDFEPGWAALGKVNEFRWNSAEPGTMLFLGASPDMLYYDDTGYRVRVTYCFLFREQGHNAYWDITDSDWKERTTPIYPSYDFYNLGLQDFFWMTD
jgi:hypothetical protein